MQIIKMRAVNEFYTNLLGNCITDKEKVTNISILVNYVNEIFDLFYDNPIIRVGYNRPLTTKAIEYIAFEKFNCTIDIMYTNLFELLYEVANELELIKPKIFFGKINYEFERMHYNQPKVISALRDYYKREY